MANWSNAAGGALSGAGIGSSFGPIGAAIGGVGGGILGLLGGGGGSKSKMKPFNKESIQALLDILKNGGGLEDNSLYNSGNSYLQNILSGSPESFQKFQAPYLENFEQNIVPGLLEKYGAMGTGAGATSSSALFNSLAQAGRSLQTDLAGLHGNLQMQALPQALQYAQQPISNRFNAANSIPGQYYERPGQEGFSQGIGRAGASAVGNQIGRGENPFSGLLDALGLGGNKYNLTAGYDNQFRQEGLYPGRL
jgi:hypothetical protein